MTMDKRIPITVLIISLIALIGSGFALESSVISDNNRIENNQLTIDMSGDLETITQATEVSQNSVDGILSGPIMTTNHKTGSTPGLTTEYVGVAHFKLFGQNATGVRFSISSPETDVTGSFVLTIEGTGFNQYNNTFNLDTTENEFVDVNVTFTAGTVYILELRSEDVTPGNLCLKITATNEPGGMTP